MKMVGHEAVSKGVEPVTFAGRSQGLKTRLDRLSGLKERQPSARHEGQMVGKRPCVLEILKSGRLSQLHRLGRAEALQLHQANSLKRLVHMPQEEPVIE